MTANQNSVRAFVAIFPPAELVEKIATAQDELKVRDDNGAVRWTRPTQIHLTLKFLGDVSSASLPEVERALDGACRTIIPFRLEAAGFGTFPDIRKPRVLWVGLEGDLESLQKLATQISSALPMFGRQEEQKFHPHLTLGRVRDASDVSSRNVVAAMANRSRERFGEWEVSEVHLMQSDLSRGAAEYRRVFSFTFQTGGDMRRF